MIASGETKMEDGKAPPKGFPPPAAAPAKPAPAAPAATAAEKTLYQEMLQVLQERYADTSTIVPSKMSEAAVGALLQALKGTACLITVDEATAKPPLPSELVDSATVIDPFIGYLRVRAMEDGTARQLQNEVQKLIQQQHINSLILDLRFARGTDFATVPAVASSFFSGNRELFSIQRSAGLQAYSTVASVFSTDISIIALINPETGGATEALAACLQDQARAILIGRGPTAGTAYETTDARLSGGKILRFASGRLTLPHKGDFFTRKVQPDIEVQMNAKLEKDIYEKPFRPPVLQQEVRYFSEAILTGRALAPPARTEDNKKENGEPSSNKDTVLQRAIDLLKGIAALQL
jgi:hypothetical protein